MRIPRSVASQLGWYVYVYVNPLDEKVFYVGKGKGTRCLAHLDIGGPSDKARVLAQIRRAGKQPRIEILAHDLRDEQTAFRVEAAAIDLLNLTELTNVVRGKDSLKLGRATLSDLVAIYSRRPVKISEPGVLIRITKLLGPYHELEESVIDVETHNGVWLFETELERVVLTRGGPDQVAIIVRGVHAAMSFLQSVHAARVFRSFNLGLMNQGPTPWGANHCFPLADHFFNEPITIGRLL